ncbi:MAG: ParB/RepB/Spo0J family partition protein [Oscillospiraceae bacterium]|nr:ParB/RepB/Spo0J family partition protein [Oscillospiraceae bacterium]
MARKGGLGKGLEALFADNTTADKAGTITLRISEIEPTRDQPRKEFNIEALENLADSIKEHGVLQPLLVRPLSNGTYQLVAGERRWRAARMAGISEVPVIIKEMTEQEVMEIALIENLQREDLNPLEEAEGYKALMETYNLTQDEVAQRVGKSRPVIANAIRLLNLPQDIAKYVAEGKISSGHARALLSISDKDEQKRTADEIIEKGISVREVEQRGRAKAPKQDVAKQITFRETILEEIEIALKSELGRVVKVREGKDEKGILEIEYLSFEDLKDLANKLAK